MPEYVLELRNIVKDFPGVRALKDVSLQVRPGEILGLIGENGAGKSTLLKIVNGIYPHGTYSGEIFLNGKEMRLQSPHDALIKGIGFVPQEINVMDDLTIAENIFVGHLTEDAATRLVSFKTLADRAEKFLAENKIRLNPRGRVRMLSIAQKQSLMIARALSWNPDILILDEPTTALAMDDVKNLFDIVENLKRGGKSVIFVTHKLDEIVRLTDRVSIMRDGSNISVYDKKDFDIDRLVQDMVGRTITNLFPKRNAQIGEEILRVENLSVEHDRIIGRHLIKDVSFNLRRGEVLGLVGLVGSGRTEILETIFGKNRLASGKIFINGKETRISSISQGIARGINLVTEDRKENGLLMLANIRQNIVFSNLKKVSGRMTLSARKERAVAGEYMTKMRIKAPSSESMVVSLSGGNQQKVIVAKALNTSPSILLLDEPTKGIDVGSKNEIYNLINMLAESGMGIIVVSSELPELMGLCDRYVIVAKGTTVEQLDAAGLTQEQIMGKCFAAV